MHTTRTAKKEKQKSNPRKRQPKAKASSPRTAQKTIPYELMYPDGICQVREGYYSKVVQYQDINYQLAQEDDKRAIFDKYCEFLNYFDSSIHVQLCFYNYSGRIEDYQVAIKIEEQKDAFNDIRQEYSQMLRNQLAKGNNGLIKNKYLVFGIEANDYRTAKTRLERIELDIFSHLRGLGAIAQSLNGAERLHVMHDLLNESQHKFHFDWKRLKESGLATKDFIAPSGFDFTPTGSFGMGRKQAQVSYLQILAPELSDELLKNFLILESDLAVTLHIQSIEQTAAIKMIKRKITDLDKMKIEEQKKAIRSGYDMDILPSDLVTYGAEAKTLLESLQSRNERLFLVTFLLMNISENKRKLENDYYQTAGIDQSANCNLRPLDYQQERGLAAMLPLGINPVPIERALTTSATAIFVPFTTQELFQPAPALYYGLNALSNNLLMADRRKLKTPNGLIIGTPGSGKSFAAKREITNAFLVTEDEIIITDPESEYAPLVRALQGEVVRISINSNQYINPLDLNLDYSEEEDPVALKMDFIFSFIELAAGRKSGLKPEEKSVLDRCIQLIYQKYLQEPIPENLPILEDLYARLLEMSEPDAKYLATVLEIYVKGSYKVFNHQTNVDTQNRLICFDIRELGKQLKKLGMLVIQDQVWNRVTRNRAARKTTWFYQDEFHLMLREEQTAAYSVEIWKRFRKWGGIPTAITQNVKDLLASREIENILDNSDFIYMLNQASGDQEILAKHLNISKDQLSYVTHSGEGQGLLFYGNTIIPFTDHFPRDTKLYQIMTTKPDEV
ncbi:MAG: DUF87 domain-containing protein [Anaerolineaceae bacterium]